MSERELGPVWVDVLPEAGIYVSTIFRESSALGHPSPYYETMAFWLDPVKRPTAMLWQSAAGYERKARHQHEVAVRWFGRSSATAPDGASQNHVPPSPGAYEDEQKEQK